MKWWWPEWRAMFKRNKNILKSGSLFVNKAGLVLLQATGVGTKIF